MSSRRFFGIVLLFSVIVCVVGQCTWTDYPETSGVTGDRTVLGGPPADLATCKTRCEADANANKPCAAIDFVQPFDCFKYSTATTRNNPVAGSTHSVCSPTTTTDPPTTTAGEGACSMSQQTDTGVTSTAQVSVDLTAVGDCENLCKAIPQCLAYSHTSGTCDIHTSDDLSTSSAAGYVYARKQSCFGNGHVCCFEEAQTDTKGSSGTTTSVAANSCQNLCLAVSLCQGAAVNGNTCTFYTSTPSKTTQTGSTYYGKTCPTGADRGSLTLSLSDCDSAADAKQSQILVLWTLMTALLFLI